MNSWGSSLALVCVSLALLLQSLAPPGYMAGSLDEGWPVILCPEGLPPGFLGEAAHHHHDEHSASSADLSLDGHCPLGSVFDHSLATLAPSSSDGTERNGVAVNPDYRPPTLRGSYPSHRARAPPVPT